MSATAEFSHQLIKVETQPAIVRVNFDELKQRLAEDLKRYEITVTADTVKGAKSLATELNKTKAEIDRRRKEVVARESEPIRNFETQMKDLASMCTDGRQKILDQVKQFEDRTREQAETLLRNTRQSMWDRHGVEPEFYRAEFDDLILLTSVTAKGNLSQGARDKLEARVRDDRALQDRVRMRLVELENASYKAGLSAPLTRQHVEHFLHADDATYTAKLQRLIDTEIERQQAAEQAMRDRMEREQQQKARQELEEAKRKARLETPSRDETKAPEAPAQEPAVTATESYVETGPPETVEPPIPEGKARFIVTARFDVTAPANATGSAIASKLKKVLAEAGVTTLSSIEVERA